MPILDQQLINTMLVAVDTALTSDAKGAALEDLIKYVFQSFDGIDCRGQNILEGPRAQELDLVFWNDTRVSELHFLKDAILIVECKATEARVSSAAVGWFVRKLQDNGAHSGILVALSGITGEGPTHAHSEVLSAMIRDNIRVLLITRNELQACPTTTHLAELLQEKLLKLVLEKSVHVMPVP